MQKRFVYVLHNDEAPPRYYTAVLVACAVLLLAGAQVHAHHAFAAEFDVNKPLTLKGSLVKRERVDPHSWFRVAVTARRQDHDVDDRRGQPESVDPDGRHEEHRSSWYRVDD
jgi:hypothetical protein